MGFMILFLYDFILETQMPDSSVTFSNSSGYLLNRPWKSGELKVSFRTHNNRAIILYQTGTSDNINIFLVAVTSGME